MSKEDELEIRLERLFDDVFDMGEKVGIRVAKTVVRQALLLDSEAKGLMADLLNAYERGLKSGYKQALYADKNPFANAEEKVAPPTTTVPIKVGEKLPRGRQVGLRYMVNKRGTRYAVGPEKFEVYIKNGYWFQNLEKTGIPEEYQWLLKKYTPPDWYKPPNYQYERAPRKTRLKKVKRELEAQEKEQKADESFADAQEELEPTSEEQPLEEQDDD